MGRDAQYWERRVREHFDFLLDHGFRFDRVEENWWATSAFHLSEDFGVEVTRSTEFNRVEMTLLRLVDGQVPAYPIWVTDEPIHHALFDNVLLARAPQTFAPIPGGLSKRDVERQLSELANLLRSVAGDFLDGDDAAILEAEEVVRRRVAEHPQEMKVWLPDDASEAEEERARDQAEKDVPPNVSVAMRRYLRKPKRG